MPQQIMSGGRTQMSAEYDVSVMVRSDVDLTRRLLAREEAALREAIRTYGRLVAGMARRVVADPAFAEEVVQDTFLALWRRPAAFDPDRGSLQSFLLGVARNKAVDLVRKEESARRTKEALLADFQGTPEAFVDDDLGVEERQEVRAALAKLSDVQREAIVLAYFGGRTYREVAAELGIPEGTAKTRLRDGLSKLRQVMAARGT
jgi:RNA polymerase sigma-70 factor, ECF subfamily